MYEGIEARFRRVAPAVEYCSLRLVQERSQQLSVQRDIVQPVRITEDIGAMVTVQDGGGRGYGATSDLSTEGLRRAVAAARQWAAQTAHSSLGATNRLSRQALRADYESPQEIAWQTIPLGEKIDLLRRESERLNVGDVVTDWEAGLWQTDLETLLLDLEGMRILQRFHYLLPTLSVTANVAAETQTRTFGGHAYYRQGGLEILGQVGFFDAAPLLAEQATELLHAADCPSGRMDLVLAPDQMILQIHESIGHPLELDRILGDERNYAGTSFVTLDMFGAYRYGSPLLNVTFDPTVAGEVGSYAFDDEGEPAEREFLIQEGMLLRPLGSLGSQNRAGLPGVATARASGWNRPPIDRMANLNLEPGESEQGDLIGSVERGVYMETNCSWSIDDSRNKFQFGCEYGRMIEDGALTTVVRKPNYRGVSANFWRNLTGVGNEESFQVLGTPYCGKGEPNQLARVGHAAPACLFSDVDVFGGA